MRIARELFSELAQLAGMTTRLSNDTRRAEDPSGPIWAAGSGVDRAYVSRIERALANPTIDVLEQMAAALEAALAELFAVPKPDEQRPEPLPEGRRTQGQRRQP